MENQIKLEVPDIHTEKDADKIVRFISSMPGVEFVEVNPHNGTVLLAGGDLDKLSVIDGIEGLGYTTLF